MTDRMTNAEIEALCERMDALHKEVDKLASAQEALLSRYEQYLASGASELRSGVVETTKKTAAIDRQDADTFAKAVQAIRQLQNPWMPIETAPRDGTEVLVWMRPKVIRLGWYFKRSSKTEGWCDENGKAIQPKYWQPLPTAPETGE